MFFRKTKKEENKPIENDTINNAVFGELEYIDCAWEGDSVSSLFGEEKTVDLYVYADEDEKMIEEHQEKVYQNYLRDRTEIEDAVRKVIFREFKLSEDFDLSSRFRVSSIIVTCDGNCGISIVDNACVHYCRNRLFTCIGPFCQSCKDTDCRTCNWCSSDGIGRIYADAELLGCDLEI